MSEDQNQPDAEPVDESDEIAGTKRPGRTTIPKAEDKDVKDAGSGSAFGSLGGGNP